MVPDVVALLRDTDRIENIAYARLAGTRPRIAGRNARLPPHGGTIELDLVRVRIAGIDGYGWSRLEHGYAQEILGRTVRELFAEGGVAPPFRGLEFPLLDWLGKKVARPVYTLFVPAGHSRFSSGSPLRVPCYDTSLYFDEPDGADDEAAVDAFRAFVAAGKARGHRSFKIKVGRGARYMPVVEGTRRDIAVIRAVREEAGPSGEVMIDANNGYNLNLAKDVLEATSECRLHWIEEAFHEDPVLYTDLREWMSTRNLSVKIADGEGQADPRIVEWARDGLVDVLQYDLRYYGFHRLLEVARGLRGSNAGIAPHNYGGAFGNYASGHLAPLVEHFTFVEWDEARVDGLDASGYRISGGMVTIPDSPGFGLAFDEAQFEKRCRSTGWSVE